METPSGVRSSMIGYQSFEVPRRLPEVALYSSRHVKELSVCRPVSCQRRTGD